MHAGQRSMCGVIVVDAGKSRSTCHGRDAYIVGERSNSKKNPTHMQDHGDA